MKTITVVSDLHIGSSVGLCDESGFQLSDGGVYLGSKFQNAIWKAWQSFFSFANSISANAEKKILIINGDLVDGAHHNTVALATNNIESQEDAAIRMLQPVTKDFDMTFVTRGTEAHTQPGAQSDERIAKGIGAVKDEIGQYSRWQLWLDVDNVIFNIAHHIGTTSSAAYESSAVMREMVAGLVEAGQWGQRLPDVMIRSHRHRFIGLMIPSINGMIQGIVTPGWQLRSPYVERIDRMRMPHIGGVVFCVEDGACQIRQKLFPVQTATPTII